MYVYKSMYDDFDGKPCVETLYFNLTKKEVVDMQFLQENSLLDIIQRTIAGGEKNTKEILWFMNMLIDASYGVRSEDGTRFIKSPDVLADFKSSLAFDKFYDDLLFGDIAADFITKVFPRDLLVKNKKAKSAKAT